MNHDLEGKCFTFDLYSVYSPTCTKRNVLKFKGVIDRSLTILDVYYYADRIMAWYNINNIYFYARRSLNLDNARWSKTHEYKISLAVHLTGEHDLYIIEKE